MKDGFGPLIYAFIAVVVIAAFIPTIADSTTDATEVKTVINESVAFVNNTDSALANSQLVAVSSVRNASLQLVQGAPGSGDYTVDLAQGKITFNTLNATVKNRNYDVTYTYRNVGDSTSRALTGTIVLMAALGAFLVVLAILSPAFREMIMSTFQR